MTAAEPVPPLEFLNWAPTPPMGWNSYDCFSYKVSEKQVRENADYMASRLKQYGWQYVVVDYVWSAPYLAGDRLAPQQSVAFEPRLNMDQFGRLVPDENRFPSSAGGKGLRPLADYVHAQGLKFGIHVMRGIPRQAVAAKAPIARSNATADQVADVKSTCRWLNHMVGLNMKVPGAQAYLNSLMDLYASWGVDFVKVDDLSLPYYKEELEGYRKAIDQCGRPIVLSLSPGGTPFVHAEHVVRQANMWRLLGDLWDNWSQVRIAFDQTHLWEKQIGNGHWPDPDMLPLGRLRKDGPPTGKPDTNELAPDEQRSLMTLWCMARCPLMFGGNLPDTDAFTLSLITNPEVLAVNQHSANNRQLFRRDDQVAWLADAPNGGKYLALFDDFPVARFDENLAAFKSGLVNSNTPGQAVDIDVDVTGAKQLWLVVTDGGDGLEYDHADWAEPRLLGPQGELKLTDLKPIRAECGWGQVQTNRAVGGGALVINNQPVSYGIGTHSISVVTYDLPGGYTRFKARGGLDKGGVSRAPNAGASVRFLVFTRSPMLPRPERVQVNLAEAGFKGECSVRDLWERRELGTFQGAFAAKLPRHGCVLYRLRAR